MINIAIITEEEKREILDTEPELFKMVSDFQQVAPEIGNAYESVTGKKFAYAKNIHVVDESVFSKKLISMHNRSDLFLGYFIEGYLIYDGTTELTLKITYPKKTRIDGWILNNARYKVIKNVTHSIGHVEAYKRNLEDRWHFGEPVAYLFQNEMSANIAKKHSDSKSYDLICKLLSIDSEHTDDWHQETREIVLSVCKNNKLSFKEKFETLLNLEKNPLL